METVLVTGGAGYVGSGLLRHLLRGGFRVVCAADCLKFGGESIIDIWHEPNFRFFKVDVNKIDEFEQVVRKYQYNAVIHLAAIVGDPACKREAELAVKTNWETSKWLLEKCMELGISRFIFASTCSNYGKMAGSDSYVDENSPLSPVSLYAELESEI